MEARHAARRGRAGLRGQSRRRRGRRAIAGPDRASSATSSRAPSPSTRTRLFLRRDGKLIKIEKPDDAEASTLSRTGCSSSCATHWTVGGKTYPAGCAARRRLRGLPQGRAQASTCCSSRPSGQSLAGLPPDAAPHPPQRARQRPEPALRAHPQGRRAGRARSCPAAAEVQQRQRLGGRRRRVGRLLPDRRPTTSRRRRSSLGHGRARAPAEKLKQAPAFFDAEGLTVSQHEATSKDGTSVPYFQVSREELTLDGKNPTLLYGYGGFEISLTPGYNAVAGRGVAGEGRRLRRRQHPRRRRVRPAVAPGRAQGEPPPGLRGLHRRGRGPDPRARSPRPQHLGIRAAATAAC